MIDNEFLEKTRAYIQEKFSSLVFIEKSHQYFIGDKEFCPVSNVISKWFIPFETEMQAEKYAMKNGLKKEDVLRDWKYNNLLATTTGSLVHEFGESYGWLKAGHPEKITAPCRYQYSEETGWLIPTRPKEIAAKKFLDNILGDQVKFVGAEFKMHSSYMTGISTNMAGTFDLLTYYDNPGGKSGFILCDWKTNKSLISDYNREHRKMMLPPFSDMIDEPLSHYTLQFAAYQCMLESIGINIIGRVLIWLKDDGEYQTFKIEDKSSLFKSLL